jgi:hypothetical protein
VECPRQSLQTRGLCARTVSYRYRYCPRCRREWPAKQRSCPECVHWLGDRPLERTEWQLAPERSRHFETQSYELIGASALLVRIVRDHPPDDEQSTAITDLFREVFALENAAVSGIAGQGWLIWTGQGLRRAFQIGREIEQRLTASLPRLASILHHTASVRWGIWIDQYVVPFDEQNRPVIKDVTACAIFNFEPDNVLLSSEAVYQVNRPWENFVAAPRRLLDSQEPYGYRMVGHKRPSALDHVATEDPSLFIGRKRELSRIKEYWTGARHIVKLAITAPAGSGKTRLKEWLRRHPDLRAIAANFSLFGGAMAEFAGQLAELPPDRLDCGALVEAVVSRVRREKIEVLVLDDLHWADAAGLEFLQALIAALPPIGMFVILLARPSGRKQLHALRPKFELKLSPLPEPAMEELARHLSASGPVAAAAALRSRGNPLFVEQFAAWAAEANFRGGSSGPRTLHQIIAARIELLSTVRIAHLRQRLRWGRSWERHGIDDELGRLEAEVGRWLDRLETGDYADRVETARHLGHLERLDYEIFLTSMLVGRPRPQSGRLREAIERLLCGSADQILLDLKRRAANATSASRENISREAKRAADVLFTACNWTLATDFYRLAHSGTLWERDEIARRLAQCWRHSQAEITDDKIYSARREQNLDEKPNVAGLDLPYVWADLGRRFRYSRYFVRVSEAAEAINDRALATWAKHKAAELDVNKEVLTGN